MTQALRLLILTALLFIAGCVRSLHPLFTENDLVFKSEILGSWIDKEGDITWTFSKSGSNSYSLIHFQHRFREGFDKKEEQKGDSTLFEAHLVQLGGYFFLDLFPGNPHTRVKNDLYNFHLFPMHTFSRVWLDQDTMRIAMLENDWLKKMLAEKKVEIGHELSNGGVVLTAPTADLQRLVVKFAQDEEAFPSPGVFRRLP